MVQRGIRVRLQVFQTKDCGWGVRCRDDLDRGTFVCSYAGETAAMGRARTLGSGSELSDVSAGVVLRRVQTPVEPPPPKLTRSDLPSDDEVEVVTEWRAPAVVEGRSNLLETPPPPPISPSTSPPLHVPVIQRAADSSSAAPQDDQV